MASGRELRSLPRSGAPRALASGRELRSLALRAAPRALASGRELSSLPLRGAPRALALLPDPSATTSALLFGIGHFNNACCFNAYFELNLWPL